MTNEQLQYENIKLRHERHIMTTQKILYQNNNKKIIQYTVKDEYGIITYCLTYHKHYHKSFKDGFQWVII